MAFTYRSITPQVIAAADKKPGHADLVLFCLHGDITNWATTINDGSPGSTKIIASSHTFGVNNGFKSVQCKAKSIEPTGEAAGEVGGQVITYKYKVIIKGDSAEINEFVENLVNEDVVFLFNDPVCGQTNYVQLGSECSPANISGFTYRGGTKGNGGFKEYEFVVESTDKFFYEGNVTMVPATSYLTAPADLSITGNTANSLTVAWDAVPDAETYEVQSSASPDFSGASIQTVTDPTVTATIGSLLASTTYYVRVRAKATGKVTSPWSTVSGATTA